MAKRKAPLTQEQKKKNKIENQRQRREKRKAKLISLGVKNPSKYYNSEKDFNEIVAQREKEIKRQKKYNKEKERQERNIKALQEKGVHESWINSLKRKSAQFIGFIDPKSTPSYFEEKPKVKKTVPNGEVDISPLTLYLAWWDKSKNMSVHDEIESYSKMSEHELKKSIEHTYQTSVSGSPYKGGRLSFGIVDQRAFEGMRTWYMTTGASTEGLNKFDLQQLLLFLATVSDLMNRDQSQEFYQMVLEIKSFVPETWHEYLPEIEFHEYKF